MGKPETDKLERFVAEYLVDLNATQAYLRSHPGVTNNTARTEGSRLLAKPDIQEKISAAKLARAKRTQVTQDRIVRELARVGFRKLGRIKAGPKVRALQILLEHVKTTDGDGKDLAETFADLAAEAEEWEKNGGEE